MQHGTVSHNFSVGVVMTRLPATLAPTEQSSQPPPSPCLTQHLPQNCSFISGFIRWSPALWSACCIFSARGLAKILFQIWSWHKKLNTKSGLHVKTWRGVFRMWHFIAFQNPNLLTESIKLYSGFRRPSPESGCNFPLVPPSSGWRVAGGCVGGVVTGAAWHHVTRCCRCATLGRPARTEMGRGEEERRHAGPWSQWRTGLGEDEQRRGAESSQQPRTIGQLSAAFVVLPRQQQCHIPPLSPPRSSPLATCHSSTSSPTHCTATC